MTGRPYGGTGPRLPFGEFRFGESSFAAAQFCEFMHLMRSQSPSSVSIEPAQKSATDAVEMGLHGGAGTLAILRFDGVDNGEVLTRLLVEAVMGTGDRTTPGDAAHFRDHGRKQAETGSFRDGQMKDVVIEPELIECHVASPRIGAHRLADCSSAGVMDRPAALAAAAPSSKRRI